MILLTGGAGYIGSHVAVELLLKGEELVIFDNFSNSYLEVLDRIEEISHKKVTFVEGDLRDFDILDEVFNRYRITEVLHFAGLKSVKESVRDPVSYYDNNVGGTLNLIKVMIAKDVRTIVFSSSATVYGTPVALPLREDMPTGPCLNPYGNSKLVVENVLMDLVAADPRWSISLLRYFNPVGAHKSGLIGENPTDEANNLMPLILDVATGRRQTLSIFGDDYDTRDGTCVRDFIHVVDLAYGHLKALTRCRASTGCNIYNLGTGVGFSVLELIKVFEGATGQPLSYQIAKRRPGDAAECYSDPSKAKRELGWESRCSLTEMCEDAWRWQLTNT